MFRRTLPLLRWPGAVQAGAIVDATGRNGELREEPRGFFPLDGRLLSHWRFWLRM
jgi:hypothetical protein